MGCNEKFDLFLKKLQILLLLGFLFANYLKVN